MSLKKTLISIIIVWAIAILFHLLSAWAWWKIEGFPWGEALKRLTDGILLPWLFLEAFVFVFIFTKLYKGIPGTGIRKGLLYGFIIWLISSFLVTTPGIISSFSDMHYFKLLAFDTANILVLSLIRGLIIGIIFRREAVNESQVKQAGQDIVQ